MIKYILSLLLISTTALAQVPNKKYDYPYKGKLTTTYHSVQELHKANLEAFAIVYNRRKCDVHLPYPTEVSPKFFMYLRRHELAHCNGWHHKGE